MVMPNPFLNFLEEKPEIGYQGYLAKFGAMPGVTPNMKKYFQNQFGAIQDQYMGLLGQQVLGGGTPDTSWMDFLKNMDFGQTYAGMTPQQKGTGNVSQFNPMTKWILGL